jgi:nucleoside-diphosphate-sugar epimerase
MDGQIVIFGYGAVGHATAEALNRCYAPVRVAQRHRPADLPPGVTFATCDILDAQAVARAVEGAAQVVLAVGFPYDRRVWSEAWPKAMANVLAACSASGARMVFVDDLYMLGPQNEPLREDMPLTSQGAKPAIRADITRQWMAANAKVRVAALRVPDFYGPGVGNSHIGDSGFGRMARGKTAFLLAPPDTPHDFAYVPDVAKAVVTLLDAPDDAYGEVWNMPCAPTMTPREILALGAKAIGAQLKVAAIPLWALPLLGLVSPMMREVADVSFMWDRPYRVDASKFANRFWSDVTPFEIGASLSARSAHRDIK